MNRDTEYSFGVFDLTNPVTITMPDPGERFQSFQVINEDQYTKMVHTSRDSSSTWFPLLWN